MRESGSTAVLVGDLAFGLAIGVAIAWIGVKLDDRRFFRASGLFQPLNAFAIGLLVLAVCYRTGANLFLAALEVGEFTIAKRIVAEVLDDRAPVSVRMCPPELCRGRGRKSREERRADVGVPHHVDYFLMGKNRISEGVDEGHAQQNQPEALAITVHPMNWMRVASFSATHHIRATFFG